MTTTTTLELLRNGLERMVHGEYINRIDALQAEVNSLVSTISNQQLEHHLKVNGLRATYLEEVKGVEDSLSLILDENFDLQTRTHKINTLLCNSVRFPVLYRVEGDIRERESVESLVEEVKVHIKTLSMGVKFHASMSKEEIKQTKLDVAIYLARQVADEAYHSTMDYLGYRAEGSTDV